MKKTYLLLLLLVFCLLFIAKTSWAEATSDNTKTTTESGYTLPESYYNSLKPIKSNTKAASTTTAKQTKTTAPLPSESQVAAPVAEPAKTNKAVPKVAKEETKKQEEPIQTKPLQTEYKPKQYNLSYVVSELGAIRQEIEELKTGKGINKTAGYDGGFFMKSDDGKFLFNINGKMHIRYSLNIAEDLEDGHGFALRRISFVFSGNAFSEKFVYTAVLTPNKSTSLYIFEMGYTFHDYFNLFFSLQPIGQSAILLSSSGMAFITLSMPVYRFDYGGGLGLSATGSIGNFSYAVGVTNGQATGYGSNTTTEMFYAARFDYSFLGGSTGSAQGDVSYSEKPVIVFGVGGAYGHMEDGTQARIIGGAADLRFKYKGISFLAGGHYRQIDPDQFTRAQTDIGAVAFLSYFPIPKKLEIAVRGDVLFDDITSAGNNLLMFAAGDTALSDNLAGGDLDGDSANEYAGTFCIGYYFAGKNAKIQAEYKYMLDGVSTGADSRTYHIGQLQVQMGF